MPSPSDMVTKMAKVLAGSDADLGDERACLRALQQAHFALADIVTWVDKAQVEAKNLRAVEARS